MAINDKLDTFIQSIKNRFNNKVYEKENPQEIETENTITDWLNQEEDPPLRYFRRELSANMELDLGIEINDLFNLEDIVKHGKIYRLKIIDDMQSPLYGGAAPFSFCVSNILSCLLLNKLVKYKAIYLNPRLQYIDYSEISLSIGILLYSARIISPVGHTCCFIECNKIKVFINNNIIIPYRWDILFMLYNTLIEQQITCKIIYNFNNTTQGPMIYCDDKDDLYYIDNNEFKVFNTFSETSDFNNYFSIDSLVLVQFDDDNDIFYKNNFIEFIILYIFFNNYNKLEYIITLHNYDIDNNVAIDDNIYINNFNHYYSTSIIGNYPLIYACIKGYYEIVSILLNYRYIDVNIKDTNDMVPILYACQYNYSNIVNILLDKNIDFNNTDRYDNNIISIVCIYNSYDCFNVIGSKLSSSQFNKLILLSLLTHTNVNNHSPLILAYKYNSNECFEILVNCNVQVNELYDNYTILQDACNNNNNDIVKILMVRPDLDINYQDVLGNTALHIACGKGNYIIVQMLLENEQININIENQNLQTPLMIVNYYINTLVDNTRNNYIEIYKLLNHKININEIFDSSDINDTMDFIYSDNDENDGNENDDNDGNKDD